jgi:hypothetical protein
MCPYADNDNNDIDQRAAQSKLKDLRTVASLKFRSSPLTGLVE